MKRTLECILCGHKETKNGEWNARFAIETHLMEKHPKEFKDNRDKNIGIEQEIRKLRNTKEYLYK
jgi:hypothetical protein